jgi:RHS repeat-associated protein
VHYTTVNTNGSGAAAANFTNVPAGTHNITAIATNAAGQATTTPPLAVVINPSTATTAPSISITSPRTNSAYTAPAAFSVSTATIDPNGKVPSVEFQLDGAHYSTVNTNGAGISTANLTNVPVGTHTVSAIATGVTGLSATASITVTVNAGIQSGISFVSPVSGQTFQHWDTISVTITDPDNAVHHINVYESAVQISGLGNSGTGIYSTAFPNAVVGTHTFIARAFSAAGVELGNTSVTFSVVENNLASVSILSPNGQTYTVPATVPLLVTASRADGSISAVGVYDEHGVQITGLNDNGTGNYATTFFNVPAGTHTWTAKAFDAAGVSTQSNPVTFTVIPNTPPLVSISSPTSAQTYIAPATIPFMAVATDGGGGAVTAVGGYENGVQITGLNNNGTGNYATTFFNVGAGTHTWIARAFDNGGLSTDSAPVTFTVLPHVPPVVKFVSPSSSTPFVAPATVPVVVNATGASSPMNGVNILENGQQLTGINVIFTNGTGSYSTSFANVAVGTHTWTATALDIGGGTTSSTVTFRVYPSQPPTVSITAPDDHQSAVPGNPIALSANAADSDGTITQVQFFNGATPLGTAALNDGTNKNGIYTLNWASVPAGTYSVAAVATDNTGIAVTSSPIVINVDPSAAMSVAVTPPPVAASYTAPASIPLTAMVSNNDYDITDVQFFNGANLISSGLQTSGVATSGSFVTNAWTNVPAGTYSITASATNSGGLTVASTPVIFTVNAASSGAATTTYFIEADQIDAPRVVEDQNQQVVWRWSQGEPFGDSAPDQSLSSGGAMVFNLRFPGQYFDRETNTSYNSHRDYDPTNGRYVQSDPLSLDGGINAYAYVGGNPLSAIDPLGLSTVELYCLKDPVGCAEIFGDLAQNSAAISEKLNGQSGESCTAKEAAASFANALHVAAWVPAVFNVRNLVKKPKTGATIEEDELFGLCFIAGTLVHTSDGAKPIEQIALGDKVDTLNIDTGKIEQKEVVALFRNKNKLILDVVVGDGHGHTEHIGATPEHPFWVQGKGWIPANKLLRGDVLKGMNETRQLVLAVVQDDRYADTFNFEVSGTHNYFVGGAGILVHNASKWNDKIRKKPGSLGQAKGTDALRRENDAARDVAKALGIDRDKVHQEISGQGLNGYQEILQYMKDLGY